jgi:3-methyladenine DNA glycosylase AlkD
MHARLDHAGLGASATTRMSSALPGVLMPATAKPTAQSILDELRPLGSDAYRQILLKHGAKDPIYGVKIEHLKKIQKRIKTDYQLALDLFDTGVYDAMYLAGLIADDARMTKKDLRHWVETARSPTLCAYTVAPVAAGSKYARELALEWIDAKVENTASAGWTTLSFIVGGRDDDDLDLNEIKQLLHRVATAIHDQPDHVRYAMNGFVISVGCYVKPLTNDAVATARKVGTVKVDMGDTACKVPDPVAYIDKVKKRGTLGKKRKSAKC